MIDPDLENLFACCARLAAIPPGELTMTTQPRIVCPKCQGKRTIYLGCDDQIPCVECNSTGEKYLDPTAVLRLKATARTRADIAGRIMAALVQADHARYENVIIHQLAPTAVAAADALLAELERTAK